MKTYILFISLFVASLSQAQEINWVSLEKAEAIQKENPEKEIFINFYTDWCGWCKKMEKSTFKDESVTEIVNNNYIPVRFNAENKKEVTFRGKTYKYIDGGFGRRGMNAFAYFALKGQSSYPSSIILGADGKTKKTMRGYFAANDFLNEIKTTN